MLAIATAVDELEFVRKGCFLKIADAWHATACTEDREIK